MQNYQFERDEGYDILDPFGAGVGYYNPYPTEPPSPNDPNADCDYTDHGHGEQEPFNCTLPDDFDDQSDEDSQVGSVPENSYYNGIFKIDFNDMKNDPEDFEPEGSGVGIASYSDGSRKFVLQTGDGYWIDENDPNHVKSKNPDVIDVVGTRTRFVQADNNNGFNFFGSLQKDQEAKPTPLSGFKLKTWEFERDRLLKMLKDNKSDCFNYLKDKFDIAKIVSNLEKQIPYDMFKSKNDANIDFGEQGITVSQKFTNDLNQRIKDYNSTYKGAATGNTGNIYYYDIELAIILHETIHATNEGTENLYLFVGFDDPKGDPNTGLKLVGKQRISDNQIQSKLGITVQTNSTNITEALKKAGCN